MSFYTNINTPKLTCTNCGNELNDFQTTLYTDEGEKIYELSIEYWELDFFSTLCYNCNTDSRFFLPDDSKYTIGEYIPFDAYERVDVPATSEDPLCLTALLNELNELNKFLS